MDEEFDDGVFMEDIFEDDEGVNYMGEGFMVIDFIMDVNVVREVKVVFEVYFYWFCFYGFILFVGGGVFVVLVFVYSM